MTSRTSLDVMHYREKLAHQMEDAIIALLRSGGTGTAGRTMPLGPLPVAADIVGRAP